MAAKPMSPERNLFIVRIAMALGVLMFAALSLYLRTTQPIDAKAEVIERLRWATLGFAVAAIGIALVLRSMRDGRPLDKQRSITIGGWAAGEAAALIAIVQHFQGGAIPTMAVGIVAFAAVLMLLPIPTSLSS